jgi:iron complex outermembrane receptor protein
VQPEKVTAYELGGKLDALGDKLRLNAALFDNEISHMQSGFVSLESAGAVNFISVPHARARGAEVDGKWLPLSARDPLVLSLGASYIEGTYTDYPRGPGYQPGTGAYSGSLDLTGKRIVYTPRWSGTAGVAQGIRAGDGVFELALDEYFNAGYYADAYNTVREGAFAILNGRAGYRHEPWHLRGTLFCQNMLDRRYHAVSQQTDFGQIRTLAAPREFGARLEWEF